MPRETPARARWRVLRIGKPDRVGRWYPDRAAAAEAGVRAGVIRRTESGGYYLDALTKIEEEKLPS